MNSWVTRVQKIQPLDKDWLLKAQRRLDEQTRPQGSLGRLEDAIVRLAAIQQQERLRLKTKRILIFAGDHGVEHEGVSLYPREVTRAMVMNFLNGGATINALARHAGAGVKVVDVGVDCDFLEHDALVKAKVARGTKNFRVEPAMTAEELDRALEAGWRMAEEACQENVDILAVGEMGIANTTSASAIIAAGLKAAPALVTGRGTGVGQEGLQHKIRVIEESLERHASSLTHPLNILQHVGGYEIAAMTGAIVASACFRIPIVVDGVVAAAAALMAYQLNTAVLDYVFLSQESQERGHGIVLREFRQEPLLRLSMRLGEASGAALALGLLEAGVRVYNEVATFEEAQVAQKKESVSHP